jgi:4-amino-4-deoxy-L-arabinose transferase-like glycosyltransferase
MVSRSSRLTFLLLVSALLLGVAAQALWGRGEAALLQGALVWLLALSAYLWATHRMATQRPKDERGLVSRFWHLMGRSWVRLGLVACALVGSLLVGGASLRRQPLDARWDLLVGWLAAMLLAVAATVNWSGLKDWSRRLARRVIQPSPEAAALGALTLVAGALRFWSLESVPTVLSGDEASMGLEAARVLAGRLTNPFATGWLSHPTLYFFLQAPFVWLFGRTVSALRVSSALVSTLTVPLLYLFGRRLFGRHVALLASVILTGYHFAIHFGRLGMNNAWDPALALAALYGLDRAISERSGGWAVLAGLFGGMGAYFYMGARMVPILMVAYVLLASRGDRGFWRRAVPVLALVALGAAMAAVPLAMFWRAHPADMMARWRMLAIGPSGWLAEEAVRRGVSEATVLAGQLAKAALGWVLYTDPTFHYRATIPLLGMGSAVFFVFGLLVAARRWRYAGEALVLIWVALVVLLGGALLENPPSSPRYVIAIPAAVTLVALGVDDLCQRLGRVHGVPASAVAALSGLVVVGLSVSSARYYLHTYTPLQAYGGPNTHVAHGVARHLQGLGERVYCYMVGAPRIYYDFATIPYLNPDVEGEDVVEAMLSTGDVPEAVGRTVFIVLPERSWELQAIEARYPGGTLLRHLDERGQMLFASYLVEG